MREPDARIHGKRKRREGFFKQAPTGLIKDEEVIDNSRIVEVGYERGGEEMAEEGSDDECNLHPSDVILFVLVYECERRGLLLHIDKCR